MTLITKVNFTVPSLALWIAAATLAGWNPSASAQAPTRAAHAVKKFQLQEGSYIGKDAYNDKVYLFLNALPGSDGSYMAVLFEKPLTYRQRASLYKVDPVDADHYGLTPIGKNRDGTVGIPNDNPSLVLTIDPAGTESEVRFIINNSQSGNHAGFQGSVIFSAEQTKRKSWATYKEGDYRLPKVQKHAMLLNAIDPEQGESYSSFNIGRTINGKFYVREILPGIFGVAPLSLKNTGFERIADIYRIGFFYHSSGDNYFILVNPQNPDGTIAFEKD